MAPSLYRVFNAAQFFPDSPRLGAAHVGRRGPSLLFSRRIDDGFRIEPAVLSASGTTEPCKRREAAWRCAAAARDLVITGLIYASRCRQQTNLDVPSEGRIADYRALADSSAIA